MDGYSVSETTGSCMENVERMASAQHLENGVDVYSITMPISMKEYVSPKNNNGMANTPFLRF